MKKLKRIETLLKANAFENVNNENEWTRDDIIIRFLDDQMEIYEEPNGLNDARYLISEIDEEILEDVLKEL